MKLAWLTDIHLNFLSKQERQAFYATVTETNCDAVLITGDIAEAPSVVAILEEMAEYTQKPVYFVAGNHDYYKASVEDVRHALSELSQRSPFLFWLPAVGPLLLTEGIVLLGQDGWADGRLGDYANSRVVLNDCQFIPDLMAANALGKYSLQDKMQALADIDAAALEKNLANALKKEPKKIVVLTHVPPFEENCLHRKKVSNNDYLPFFGSKATGDVLLKAAKENPNIEYLVLCGHTHSQSVCQKRDNLLVQSGEVEYKKPSVQALIDV